MQIDRGNNECLLLSSPTSNPQLPPSFLLLHLYNKAKYMHHRSTPRLATSKPSREEEEEETMQNPQAALKLLFWALLALASLPHYGYSEKCSVKNTPTARQTQVGFGNPPKFSVVVQNTCPMCPVINIHLKCGKFSQGLVNPKLLKVLGSGDCVVNGGLPLAPLQTISFTYSHQKLLLSPSTWNFQCE